MHIILLHDFGESEGRSLADGAPLRAFFCQSNTSAGFTDVMVLLPPGSPDLQRLTVWAEIYGLPQLSFPGPGLFLRAPALGTCNCCAFNASISCISEEFRNAVFPF
jgi:hypothetical protein